MLFLLSRPSSRPASRYSECAGAVVDRSIEAGGGGVLLVCRRELLDPDRCRSISRVDKEVWVEPTLSSSALLPGRVVVGTVVVSTASRGPLELSVRPEAPLEGASAGGQRRRVAPTAPSSPLLDTSLLSFSAMGRAARVGRDSPRSTVVAPALLLLSLLFGRGELPPGRRSDDPRTSLAETVHRPCGMRTTSDFFGKAARVRSALLLLLSATSTLAVSACAMFSNEGWGLQLTELD